MGGASLLDTIQPHVLRRRISLDGDVQNHIIKGGGKMRSLLLVITVFTFLLGGDLWAQQFVLKSDDLGEKLSQAQVYSGFGCRGKNISPSLKWANAPAGAKSFAVTVFDPDAPTGSGWWHWVIFNIPGGVNELKADAGRIEKKLAPVGSVQGLTDFGKAGFGGACPPEGDKAHRYVFTIYALGIAKLDFDEKTPPAKVGSFLESKAIAKASIISYFKR